MDKIILEGEIGWWGITAEDVQYKLDQCSGDVTIELSSGGGSVFEGVLIFNKIRAYKKGKVIIVNTGICASMASYILLAGDEAKAYDNATYMIHNALTVTYGNQHDHRETADILEGLSAMLLKMYVSKTGKSESEIQAAMNKESFYFGEEALDFGFIDAIIDVDSEDEKEAVLAVAKDVSFKASNSYMEHSRDAKEKVAMVACIDGKCKAKLEQTKPATTVEKEVITTEIEAVADTSAKVRGFKARLKLNLKEV